MTHKVFFAEPAQAEADEYVDYYLANAPEGIAERFIESVEALKYRLSYFPESGSPRYEYLFPGVRFVHVGRFPFLAFYLVRGQTVVIIRILHESRDIAAVLAS